ncbi:hypothetical protein [Rossellomorea marisflavi]|uniref:hypothetical protein n=1 Tax=Rossellomorea marisflavi TaxID=189381 RepID=UPI003F9FBB5D
MRPATQKQLSLISSMEQFLGKTFKGTTVKEASAFITKHMEEYQREQDFVFEMVYNENSY